MFECITHIACKKGLFKILFPYQSEFKNTNKKPWLVEKKTIGKKIVFKHVDWATVYA